MANSLNTNPVVYTAVAASYKAAVALSQGTLFTLQIKKIVWEAPTNVGHVAQIVDPASGRLLYRAQCAAINVGDTQDWTTHPQLWADFEVARLDSGNLFIYLV